MTKVISYEFNMVSVYMSDYDKTLEKMSAEGWEIKAVVYRNSEYGVAFLQRPQYVITDLEQVWS